MRNIMPDGVWPTMITPFSESGEIDYSALDQLIDWYIENKVSGLFAVCQSSEMFYLSLEERIALADFIVKKTGGRVPIVASGISDSIIDQIEEITRMSETGINAFVIVSNRLARADESDDIWKKNAEKIINSIPDDIHFGISECPYPYKRLIAPELLNWCALSGRFLFLKDSCCCLEQLKEKMAAVKGSNLKIFNANSATLLESLKFGISGFSGVMANFHPDLYVWLCRNWDKEPEKAQEVQNFLGVASLAELQQYPVNAKYSLQQEGVELSTHCRSRNAADFSFTDGIIIKQMIVICKHMKRTFMTP